MREDSIWCMRPPAVYDVLNVETSDTTQAFKERQDASVEAAPDDAVPLAEVSVANFDAV